MHLITGKKGTPHVTSENHGFLNSRMVGRGRFVFNFSHNFEAVKLSNNSVQIRSGQGMLNGRHFEIEEGQTESVAIESGTVGMNRNDIIVARYEKGQNGHETLTLVAVKGTAVSGTPSDPAVNEGNVLDGDSIVDFPLYRVIIEDTDIEEIVQMFDVVDFDIAEMQEAVTETLENVEETLAELEDSLEDVENKPYKYVGSGEPFIVPTTDFQRKVGVGDLYLDETNIELWICSEVTKNASDVVTHAFWFKIASDYHTPRIYETWSAPTTNPSHYTGVEIGDILLRYDEEYTALVNNVYIAEMVTTLGTPQVKWREIVTDRSEKWNDYYLKSDTNTLLNYKLDRADGIKVFYGATEPTQSLLNGSMTGDIYLRLNGSDREVSQIIGMWLVSVYPSSGTYYWQKIPLGDYYNKTETDNLLNAKQDTLTAGTNITIDANNVISATGGGGGDIPAPTTSTRGGIYARTEQDTSNMQEVVVGTDGKAYVYNDYTSLVETIVGESEV